MSKSLKPSSYAPPAGGTAPPGARLKVIKGPHKGVVYKLVAGKISIGRSSDNDIILDEDEKCSRKQAIVSMGPGSTYSVKDISKKASLKVNDIVKFQSDLIDGDLIQFGQSVLQFEFKGGVTGDATADNAPYPSTPPPAGVPAPAPATNDEGQSADLPALKSSDQQLMGVTPPPPPVGQGADMGGFAGGGPAPAYFPAPDNKPTKKNKPLLPKIILIVLVLGVLYLMTDNSESKKEQADSLRTNMEREESVKNLSELKEKEEEKREKNKIPSYKHAQFAYIKGIRDYRKGVYNRAIESFRACKTLYPQHDLCPSYLQKAQAKNQQLIQAWMTAGKEYREKRRFPACISSFKNVMMAIRDKDNLTYKEARENYDICLMQYKDRY